MKSAIVTGCTGIVGKALIQELLSNDTEVLAILRNKEYAIQLEASGVKTILCTLDDLDNILLEKKYDVFYHLAWDGTRGPSRFDENRQKKNVEYTMSAIRLAKRLGCKKFVGVGSQAEYGQVPKNTKLSWNLPTYPESAYGRYKLEACNNGKNTCKQLGMDFCWGRIVSTYGPNDDGNTLIMSCIRDFYAGKSCDMTPCTQIWDYIYIGDVANAFRLIGESGKNGSIYVIGSGYTRQLKEYVNDIYKIVGNNTAKCNFGAKDFYKDQAMFLCADISNLTEDTGFLPNTDFEIGIKKTVQWYSEYLGKEE